MTTRRYCDWSSRGRSTYSTHLPVNLVIQMIKAGVHAWDWITCRINSSVWSCVICKIETFKESEACFGGGRVRVECLFREIMIKRLDTHRDITLVPTWDYQVSRNPCSHCIGNACARFAGSLWYASIETNAPQAKRSTFVGYARKFQDVRQERVQEKRQARQERFLRCGIFTA